jgi:hypothetical protein
VSSQQVSFAAVCETIQPFLDTVGEWPAIGTPEWLALSHDDRRWWAAVLDASRHWALRLEGCQEAMAQASQAISGMDDWGQVARQVRDHQDFVAENPWAKRVAS